MKYFFLKKCIFIYALCFISNSKICAQNSETYKDHFRAINVGFNYSVMSMSNAYFTRKYVPNLGGTPFIHPSLAVTDKQFTDDFASLYPMLTFERFGKQKWGNRTMRGLFYCDISGLIEAIVVYAYDLKYHESLPAFKLSQFDANFPAFTKNNVDGGIDYDLIQMRCALGPTFFDDSWAIEPGLQFSYGGHNALVNDEGAAIIHVSRVGTLAYGAGLNFVKPSEKYLLRISVLYNKIQQYATWGLPGHSINTEVCVYAFHKLSANIYYNYIQTDDQENYLYLGEEYRKLLGGTFRTSGIRLGYTF